MKSHFVLISDFWGYFSFVLYGIYFFFPFIIGHISLFQERYCHFFPFLCSNYIF